MDLDQLRTFVTVLDEGSFSRAAQVLRVGQSTVSFHIKALETAAAARLCDRRGGQVRPTAAGRLLLRYAVKLLALRDEALARLRAEESGDTGRVTLAASTIPAEYLLPPILAEFRRLRPRVAITVTVSDSRRAVASLLLQECELALVGARTPDKRLSYSPFADDEVVLVGRAGRKPHARLPLILREEGSGTRDAVADLVARDHDGAPIQVGSSEAAKRCVLEGLGVAYLSRRAVAAEVADGRLMVLPAPGTPAKRRFYAARWRSASLSAPARALLQLLQKNR